MKLARVVKSMGSKDKKLFPWVRVSGNMELEYR